MQPITHVYGPITVEFKRPEPWNVDQERRFADLLVDLIQYAKQNSVDFTKCFNQARIHFGYYGD
jgi:hypothetical protein